MKETFSEIIRKLKNRKSHAELTKKVFDNEDGRELLKIWLTAYGITKYTQTVNEEQRIRKDEGQRFVHSILRNLAMSEDELLEQSIRKYQEKKKNLEEEADEPIPERFLRSNITDGDV